MSERQDTENLRPNAPSPEAEESPSSPGSLLRGATQEEEKARRRQLLLLLLLLVLLLLCLCGTVYLFIRYLQKPEPLPELVPVPVEANYPPHYLFSIYGVDEPVGVALSPEGDRVYVAESAGERLIKVFDPEGNFLFSFAPPRTTSPQRVPVYLATDAWGRVYVSDRLQHAVFVYDRDGNFLDALLSPDLTLTEYVAQAFEGERPPGTLAFNLFEQAVYVLNEEGEIVQSLPAPPPVMRTPWAPLGVYIDPTGRLFLTDVIGEEHRVLVYPAEAIMRDDWTNFDPPVLSFGTAGEEEDQFLFPNMAVVDALGRIIVSDGNNGRLSVWDEQGNFLYLFAAVGDGGLNLPRGMELDDRQRLHVVDTVGQGVRVYDFSVPEPQYLFTFGTPGKLDGQFNFPVDIAITPEGRLYITDRANNRVQVWSY